MNKTLDYYNHNANSFVESTVAVNFTKTQDRFLNDLPDNACILDFGCGSGRDTKYFLEKGYRVYATDGSLELCKRAGEITGIPVRHLLFQELNEFEKYDGIWACSSILHLPKAELKPVLVKMMDALTPNGIIYTSFKYGNFEGERGGRYFSDFTSDGFAEYVKDIENMSIEEAWVTGDVRPGREEEKWLNLILRKTAS